MDVRCPKRLFTLMVVYWVDVPVEVVCMWLIRTCSGIARPRVRPTWPPTVL